MLVVMMMCCSTVRQWGRTPPQQLQPCGRLSHPSSNQTYRSPVPENVHSLRVYPPSIFGGFFLFHHLSIRPLLIMTDIYMSIWLSWRGNAATRSRQVEASIPTCEICHFRILKLGSLSLNTRWSQSIAIVPQSGDQLICLRVEQLS